MRKRKKAPVIVDEPRPTKPFAVVLSSAAVVGCGAILFNTFFNQPIPAAGSLASAPGDASARVTVVAGQKTSRTITLKYDPLVEDIQRELLATGHFSGLVDGVTGPRTKVAVETYQRENKMDITGEISAGLLEHIQYTRKLNQAAEFTGSVSPQISINNNADNPPVLPALQVPKPTKKAAAKPQAPSGGDNAVAKLQQRLAMLGYDPGSRSGQLDEGTRSAILIFEMDHGLPMQGKISKSLLSALKAVESKKKP